MLGYLFVFFLHPKKISPEIRTHGKGNEKREQLVRGRGRKKRNQPLASTSEKHLGPATLDAGFAFAMETDRDDPSQEPTNLERFLPFPLSTTAPPTPVSGRSGKERVNWLQEYSKLY